MPCIFCSNPALCNPVCRAFEFAPDAVKAQMREACAKSGQMTAQEASAHVEAGEMTLRKCDATGSACRSYCSTGECWMKAKPRAAPKGEAGEMEAAKGDS